MALSHGSVHLFVVNCNEGIYTICLQYSSFLDNGMASLIESFLREDLDRLLHVANAMPAVALETEEQQP